MSRLVFDIETNAVDFDDLAGSLHTIHCITAIDIDTRAEYRFNDQDDDTPSVEEGVALLGEAEELAGHNILGFDIPAIKVLYPKFNPKGKIRDTKVMSTLIYPDRKERDFRVTLSRNPDFPKHLIGRHTLESWGARMGYPKDDYSDRCKAKGIDPWAAWSQEMEDYCLRDVEVNLRLYEVLVSQGFSEDSIELEQDVSVILRRQEKYGFPFDVAAASRLYSKLVARKGELEVELKKIFEPFYVKNGPRKLFKKDMKRWKEHPRGAHTRKVKGEEVRGYYEFVGGSDPECPVNEYQPIKLVEFNPGSRDHIAQRLQKVYGWKPKAYGNDGKPTVDESTLKPLKYKPVPHLLKYLLISKRIGQIAEGKEAWLKCEKNGRIHGRVNPMGAVTSRMTHSKPNVAQTPAGYSPYGNDCRACFVVGRGKKLVGMDADALELRCLAGYMARWDNGEYIKVVLEGKKEDGTDIHSRNRDAVQLRERDAAKTWFYAFIYGAGNKKLGEIIRDDMPKGQRPRGNGGLVNLGKTSRTNFEKNLPALGTLSKRVKSAAVKRGKVRGLDGRFHPVRSEHAALNTLLQGAGAILMKRALVILDKTAQAKGWVPGVHYEFVANIHDELQAEVDEDIAEEFGQLMSDSLEQAGQYYNFACPITGGYDVGDNWSQTH